MINKDVRFTAIAFLQVALSNVDPHTSFLVHNPFIYRSKMYFNHKQISSVCPIQLNLNLHYCFTLSLAPTKNKFQLAGWYENPIKSVVLTFPLDKIVFPAVTLCPRDSRPDRWGSAIKIFDLLNTNCGSKR